MHTDIQNDKYLITHVKMLPSLTYSLLTSSEFSSGGLKMQLINIHLADKSPLVIKFAKHWFIIVVIFRRIVFQWTTLHTPKQFKKALKYIYNGQALQITFIQILTDWDLCKEGDPFWEFWWLLYQFMMSGKNCCTILCY